MSANIEELERRRAAAREGGGAKRVAAQHAKGKLTAREQLPLRPLALDRAVAARVPRLVAEALEVRELLGRRLGRRVPLHLGAVVGRRHPRSVTPGGRRVRPHTARLPG